MSEAYAGKSDQDIINEQAASLDRKGDYQQPESFNPRNTALSEDSGLNESGVESEFPGVQISTGRNGQTGGGTNPQIIPPEEGGDDRSQRPGETSARFEGAMGGQEQRYHEALTSNPGGFNATSDKHRTETVPRTEDQSLEPDQEGTARSYAFNS